jgi:hypothetical protein
MLVLRARIRWSGRLPVGICQEGVGRQEAETAWKMPALGERVGFVAFFVFVDDVMSILSSLFGESGCIIHVSSIERKHAVW